MRVDVIAGVLAHPSDKVSLTGFVCGVEACGIVADGDEIVVGSAIQCDLVVPDPLIPARAFRLRREKCHAGTERDCRCYWILESFRDARVYVNRRLTRHEKISYGDVVSIGCHDLEFLRESAEPRNSRLNRNVSDICRRLTTDYPLPPGFLRGTPTYQYFKRRRIATSIVGAVACILLLCVWTTPRDEYFEPVQPALEVNIAEATVSAEAVRSLEAVTRQAFDTKDPTLDKADLVDVTPKVDEIVPPPTLHEQPVTPAAPATLSGSMPDSGALALKPLIADVSSTVEIERDTVKLAATTLAAKQTVVEIAQPAEKPLLAKHSETIEEVTAPVLADAKQDPLSPPKELHLASTSPAWKLPATRPASVEVQGPVLSREVAKLAAAAPVRRLSVEEAAQRATEKSDLAGFKVKMDEGLAGKVSAKVVDQNLSASLGKPSADNLSVDRAAYMEQLANHKASPVQFEEFKGMQVPVARISEQLAALDATASQDGTALTVDGTVNTSEMDVCWKSGCFKMHARGNPPPDANPATYCYVGKTTVNGKECLYVSFVCVDPDVSKIKAAGVSGVARSLVPDDSIELYLDTNNDRKDYYQLIVNAQGRYWAGYWAVPMSEGGKATDWNAALAVKSTINKSGGQWACELTIPFEKLGGVPPKGARWAVNFCRNFRGQQGEDWQLQSWFAVYDKDRNYHHPSLFGIFQW